MTNTTKRTFFCKIGIHHYDITSKTEMEDFEIKKITHAQVCKKCGETTIMGELKVN